MEKRITADCRKFPSKKNCTLTISGSFKEVFPVALYHAVKHHGHKDTLAFRKEMKGFLGK